MSLGGFSFSPAASVAHLSFPCPREVPESQGCAGEPLDPQDRPDPQAGQGEAAQSPQALGHPAPYE